MSGKFSTSRELLLRIGDSTLRKSLLAGFCCAQVLACTLLYRGGHEPFSLLLLAVLIPAWPGLFRGAATGLQLGWRSGSWYLDDGRGAGRIEVLPRSSLLPWVIYLAWREPDSRRRGGLWLYRDSLAEGEWRRLRSRIALER